MKPRRTRSLAVRAVRLVACKVARAPAAAAPWLNVRRLILLVMARFLDRSGTAIPLILPDRAATGTQFLARCLLLDLRGRPVGDARRFKRRHVAHDVAGAMK